MIKDNGRVITVFISKQQPENKNVLWLDVFNHNVPLLKIYKNGMWMNCNDLGYDIEALEQLIRYVEEKMDEVIDLQQYMEIWIQDTTGEVEDLIDRLNEAAETVVTYNDRLSTLEEEKVVLSESEYDDLVEHGLVDPNKYYFIYEE